MISFSFSSFFVLFFSYYLNNPLSILPIITLHCSLYYIANLEKNPSAIIYTSKSTTSLIKSPLFFVRVSACIPNPFFFFTFVVFLFSMWFHSKIFVLFSIWYLAIRRKKNCDLYLFLLRTLRTKEKEKNISIGWISILIKWMKMKKKERKIKRMKEIGLDNKQLKFNQNLCKFLENKKQHPKSTSLFAFWKNYLELKCIFGRQILKSPVF